MILVAFYIDAGKGSKEFGEIILDGITAPISLDQHTDIKHTIRTDKGCLASTAIVILSVTPMKKTRSAKATKSVRRATPAKKKVTAKEQAGLGIFMDKKIKQKSCDNCGKAISGNGFVVGKGFDAEILCVSCNDG